MTAAEKLFQIPLTVFCGIIGGILVLKIGNRIRPGTMVMLGFILSAAALAISPFITTPAGFFVHLFFYTVVSSTGGSFVVPALVFAYDKEEMNVMSSLHVLAFSLPYIILAAVIGPFMDTNPVAICTLGAVLYSIAGVLFHFFLYRPAHPELYHFK